MKITFFLKKNPSLVKCKSSCSSFNMRIHIWNREECSLFPFFWESEKKNHSARFPRLNRKKFVVCVFVLLCHTQMEYFPCAMRRNDEKRVRREERDDDRAVNRRLWLQVQSDYYSDLYFDFNLCVSLSFFFVVREHRADAGLAFFSHSIFHFIKWFWFSVFFFLQSAVHLFVHSFSRCVSVCVLRAVLKSLEPISSFNAHTCKSRENTTKVLFLRIRRERKNVQLLINLNELTPFSLFIKNILSRKSFSFDRF